MKILIKPLRITPTKCLNYIVIEIVKCPVPFFPLTTPKNVTFNNKFSVFDVDDDITSDKVLPPALHIKLYIQLMWIFNFMCGTIMHIDQNRFLKRDEIPITVFYITFQNKA